MNHLRRRISQLYTSDSADAKKIRSIVKILNSEKGKEDDQAMNKEYFANKIQRVYTQADEVSRNKAKLSLRNNLEFGPGWQESKACASIYGEELDGRREEYLAVVAGRIDQGFSLIQEEWVNYRRNFFQVTAAFNIVPVENNQSVAKPTELYIYTTPETPLLIECFYVQLWCEVEGTRESASLVANKSCRDQGTALELDIIRGQIQAGGDISLSSVSSDLYTTLDRLQFKSATRNNNRHRALQEFYVLHLELVAVLEGGGEEVLVAEVCSSPLISRGRAPAHFKTKDVEE